MVIIPAPVIDLSDKTLCVKTKVEICFPVATGQATPLGRHQIDKILLNPLPIHPISNKQYSAAKLGNTVVTTKTRIDGAVFALHGWDKPINGDMQSLGCLRMNRQDIDLLIYQYLFNEILVVP